VTSQLGTGKTITFFYSVLPYEAVGGKGGDKITLSMPGYELFVNNFERDIQDFSSLFCSIVFQQATVTHSSPPDKRQQAAKV